MRMRLLFGSIAALLLVRLVLGCTWVDPSECWPNTSGGFGGSGTIPIGAGVGAPTSGDFISPPRGPLASGGTPNPCVTPESSGGSDKPPSPGSTDPFAGIDPQVLAKATLRASALAYYMDGMLTAYRVDPSDSMALASTFEQAAPTAEMAVDAWLATVDPSTIAAEGIKPRYECTEQYGCPYRARCLNPGSWSSESTSCVVVNCGSSKCTACPWFFPPMLKSLVFVSWCSYVCADSNSNVVALGAVGITEEGNTFPKRGLAWCFKP
jgi:hypothetical protein